MPKETKDDGKNGSVLTKPINWKAHGGCTQGYGTDSGEPVLDALSQVSTKLFWRSLALSAVGGPLYQSSDLWCPLFLSRLPAALVILARMISRQSWPNVSVNTRQLLCEILLSMFYSSFYTACREQ
jgi:hypothetical protein